MPDRTTIYLSGGHEVEVQEQPSEVTDVLTRSEPFHRLTSTAGTTVYIADGEVVYLEQVPA